jgi:hypothetical protein
MRAETVIAYCRESGSRRGGIRLGAKSIGQQAGEAASIVAVSAEIGLGGKAAELLEGGDFRGGASSMLRGSRARGNPAETDFGPISQKARGAGELGADGGDRFIRTESNHGIAAIHERRVVGGEALDVRKEGGQLDEPGEATRREFENQLRA